VQLVFTTLYLRVDNNEGVWPKSSWGIKNTTGVVGMEIPSYLCPMKTIIPDIGIPFKVSFANYNRTFNGVIVSIDPDSEDQKYTVQVTDKKDTDTYSVTHYPNTVIKVEALWFSPETGRKITIK